MSQRAGNAGGSAQEALHQMALLCGLPARGLPAPSAPRLSQGARLPGAASSSLGSARTLSSSTRPWPAALNDRFDGAAGDHLGLWVRSLVPAGTGPCRLLAHPTASDTKQTCYCLHACFLFLGFLRSYCNIINMQETLTS